MKVNGKSKTPITAAQSKPNSGESGGKKARTSQQASKSKNRGVQSAVLERISDGILAFDAGMNYTYLNERAGELLGRRVEDLVGKNLQEEYAGADRTPFMEACQRALETQSVVWLNEYFPTTDRWLEGRVYPSQDGVSVLFRDGMAGKADEERTRMLSLLPQQNPAPVMRLTRDAQILYANQAAAPLLETWKREGASSASFLKIKELLPQVIEKNTNQAIEIENEGRIFFCQFVPFLSEGYINIYFSDITERKQVEEALRAIVNQPGAGITRTDRAGRYTFINQAFCDLLGYAEADLAGKSIWDLTDKEVLEKNRKLFEHMLSTGEGYQIEKRLIRRNGSMIWVNVGSSPLLDADGRIVGTTAVVVDITRRKRAEESLLESARRSLYLSSLSDTIRSIESPSRIQIEAACLLGAHLKASRVAYAEVEPDGRFLVQDNYVDEVPDMTGPYSIADFIPQEQWKKFQAGRTVMIADVQSDVRFSAAQKSAQEALAVRSHIILPFVRDAKVIAVLLVQQSRPRAWKSEEVSLVEESAERIQTAIERARAASRLRDSEKRFRILANAVPSIVWTSTPEGKLLYVNDRWYEFTGLARQGSDRQWSDLKLHPDDAQTFFNELRAIKSAQSEAVAEIRIQRHDGMYRWFQTRSVPTKDEKDNITAWHGVMTDIHDRVEKDVEQRKVIDSTPFMLTRCSRDLRYLFVSRAYAEMIGRTPEEVTGRSILEVMGEKGLEMIMPYVERVLQGERVEYENRVPFESGYTPFLRAVYTPDRDDRGNVIGWFASIVDITERRQMEENLRESEHKFNIIFKKLPFTAILLKPDDNVIMDANEEFEIVFGYSKQEAVGKTTFDLGIASRPENRAHILAELQASVAIRDMELELHTKRGPRIFLVNTDIVNIGGEQYILQTAQDITERRQAEEEAKKARLQAEYETLQLRTLLENLPVGVMVTDAAGTPMLMNRALDEIWQGNRSLEALPDYSQYRAWHAETGEVLRPDDWPITLALNTGEAQPPREFRIERFDGTTGTMLSAAAPIRDREGRIIRAVAVAQDITERKQAEAAIRASEERMRLAIESNRMVAWEWDPQTDNVTTSDNLSEVYGLSAVSTAAEGFSLIWTEDLPAHREKVDRVMRTGGEYRSEFRITRPVDGRTLWLEERAIALTDREGQVIRLVGLVIDITERKRAEQDLAEFARQQEALFTLADKLSNAASLQEMYDPALDAILSALQCDRASILLFDSQDVIRFVAWRGLSDAYRQATDGHSPWKRGEKNARPISMDDIDTADLSDSLKATIRGEGIVSLAFIPLISGDKLIGKFMVYFNQHHNFNDADVELSQTIAHQLASSIERKRAEDALRQSRQRLSLTYHHAPLGIAETSLEGHFIEVNDEMCNMLGYRSDELLKLGISDVTHQEDLQSDIGLYHQLTVGEIPFYRIEKRFIRKDGSPIWTEVVRTMVRDEAGTAMYGIGGILDISERKQREEELRARTEEIETLMEVSPIAIFVGHDAACSHITGNPAAYRLVGMSEDASMNISKSAPDHERPSYRTFRNGVELQAEQLPMQTAARLGMEIEEETLELQFEDGSHKFIYAYAKPLFDAIGRSRGAIAAMLDITERMRTEQALRDSEERFSKAFRVSPDAIVISRLSDGCIIDVNNSWVTLFGYEIQEVLGKTSVELNIFVDPQERNRLLGHLSQQGSVHDFEIDIRRKSGELRNILLAVETIEINDEDCLISILHDVTGRKRAEETLRQSEERFARFMFHLPGLAWIKDIQGRYVFANAAAQKAFNRPLEEIYGRTDWEIFPPETAVQFNRNDDRAMEEEKGVQVVETLPQVDGVVHHSLVTKFPIPGPDGRPVMIGGTAFDITERVQMEHALRVARTQAENTAYRMTQLQKITAALSQVVTPSEIARMVVEEGAAILGAAAGSIMLLDEETQSLEMMYSSAKESIARPFDRFPLSLEAPASDAVRSGLPIWIGSQAEYVQRYPHLAEHIRNWGYETALAVPMAYKGRLLGTLSLSFKEPRPFSSEDQEYLLTLARQAAQALERARVETTLRLDAAMMENVSAGVYLVSASDGTILHTNPRFDSLFGYGPGEIVGKPVAILNAPTEISPEETAHNIIEALKQNGSWQGEVLSRRKDGMAFWCSATVSTFEHARFGTVWVAARQDITERKQVEAALRESEDRYRAIISQATAGIVRKDPTGKLLYVNQAFCNMLGYTDSELLGRPIWELTHEEDAAENKRLYSRLMAEGIPFHLEKRLIHKNGSTLWVTVSVSPVVDDSGRPHSAVSVYVDITGRKLAENRLALLSRVSELARESEEPEELMYAVSQAVGEYFQARRTLFNEIDLENDREVVYRDYCRGLDSVAGVHRISEYSNITTAEMIMGKTVVNRDSQLDPRTAADYERSYVKHGERSYVTVPLMQEGRWVASLWISDDRPRDWDREDVSMLEAIAERTWIAAEKLRIDRALRDSGERLRVTFNTTVVGFATLTPDTHFLDVNEAFCRIVGYSRDELLEMNYNGLIHPRFSEETAKLLAQLIAGEVPSITNEKIFVRRDATEIWVQNSLSIVRDSQGNPLHVIVICQEITERKRAEETLHQLNLELEERVHKRTIELQAANEFLRESEATSRLILESMPDAVVIIDRDGQIVHANRQVETLFGYAPGEVMGRAVETLVPPRLREYHFQQRSSYTDQQRSRRIMGLGHELYGRRKDESEFPVEVMLAPIDNSTNWDILVAIRDNTKQRQAQEALRNNEEKLRTLFEILPVGISFLDKEGKISELNSALVDILGLSKDEILKGSYKSLRFIRADGTPMPPSDFASSRARAEQKTVYNVETGIVRENGDITWTSVNAAPVQVADVEAVLVTVDITERKQAEEALHRHRERLKILSRRLVEVQEEERHAIARELHDRVGQNLAALTLNLNILRNQLSSEVLDKVGTRLNDSVNLVKEILTITRSVMADLRPNVLDDYGLDAAINEYADRFTQRYGIRVITHTPVNPTPRLDPGVEMTILRIAQEALTNIARHSQASQAVMSIEMQDDGIEMTIEDNGLGILSWQKVNQPGSHGLRIMRERAEAFGGYLKIHSTYKNGTKIEVKIPLSSTTPAKGSKERKS
ncbi:MAG: PAS domain S-box protein [Bacteroidota bacterium]